MAGASDGRPLQQVAIKELNYYGSTRWESGIEIPAHDQDFYAMKNVGSSLHPYN